MKGNIIFLGGIHGTGKGFLSKRLCSNSSLNYLSASELIKWHEMNLDSGNKSVINISKTQNKLLIILKAICKANENYLLDGHYCLLDSKQEPTKINIDVFEALTPSILLIAEAAPTVIKKRLLNRDKRDYELPLILKMQSLEKQYAEEISRKLNIPLYVLNESNIDEIHGIINKIKYLI